MPTSEQQRLKEKLPRESYEDIEDFYLRKGYNPITIFLHVRTCEAAPSSHCLICKDE